ncbi:MAG: hypothetical protein IK099_02380 [Clostridia bacterium]|nr:hypothetical protein [Clostridia bacterium]
MAEIITPVLPKTGGNENKTFVKIIAVVSMLVDHIGVVFFPNVSEMRLLGRIAFPLFAWGVVTGAEYTRNIWKYALRILIVGVISQPCYMFALNHKAYELNVFATLLLGLLGIAGIRENRFGSRFWGPALAILASCAVKVDYGYQGVLLILLLYGSRKSPGSIASMMIAYCLYWGFGTTPLQQVFGLPVIRQVSFLPQGTKLFNHIAQIQFWSILALPVILLPMRSRKEGLHLPTWLGYTFYPAHLLIIAVIRHWREITAFFSR